MRTPEDYINQDAHGYSLRDILDNITDDELIAMMKQMQVDSYNEAIADAANSAAICCKIQEFGDMDSEYSVDRKSILKLRLK